VNAFFTRHDLQFNHRFFSATQLIKRIKSCFVTCLVVIAVGCSLDGCKKENQEKKDTLKPIPTAPEVQDTAPAESARPVQKTTGPLATKGAWTVQVGAFTQQTNASAAIETLRSKGYKAYAVETVIQGKRWHRVRVGDFATKQQAGSLQETLKSVAGFRDAFVVSRESEALR